jgi:hypothetical protein
MRGEIDEPGVLTDFLKHADGADFERLTQIHRRKNFVIELFTLPLRQ